MSTVLLFIAAEMEAQVYIEYSDGAYPVDLCNCTVGGSPLNNDAISSSAMSADPSGNVFYLDYERIVRISAATGDTNHVAILPPDFSSNSLVYGTNGQLYFSYIGWNGSVNETLMTVNPVTGTLTALGELPADYFFDGDLFFYQGLLYGLMFDPAGISVIMQIPLNNPGAATVLHPLPNMVSLWGGISVIYNGIETVFIVGGDVTTGNIGLFQVNMSTGATTLFCGGIGGFDLAAGPNYVVNCCANNAGNFADLNIENACETETIALDHLGDEVLTPGSELSFVLVADSTADLPDDILQISSNATFSFNPATMNLGQTYFVAAVAASGPAGLPNWTSGCLDISFFAPVRWNPLPTVSFSVANDEVCVGDCRVFSVNFTGTAPFILTYATSFGGNQVQTFNSTTGTLQVCPPQGASPGGAVLQAVSLSDVHCTCP